MIRDLLAQACLSALRNPFRSLLTILGLSVGVTAFGSSMMTAVGAGKGLWVELEDLVQNVVEVEWRYVDISREILSKPPKTLDNNDVQAISNLPNVDWVIPMVVRIRLKVRYQNSTSTSRLECIPRLPPGAKYFDIKRGRRFHPWEQDGSIRACYIGQDVAQRIFGNTSPLGKIIHVNGLAFNVVALLEAKPDFLRRNYNNRIVVPLAQSRDLAGNTQGYEIIMVQASSDVKTSSVRNLIEQLLKEQHGIHNYKVRAPEQIIKKRQKIFYGVISVTTVLSFICLFVSGVGIMNVLLFSVKERTQEIGVRLACGTSPNGIFWLVTSEALILCAIGGIIGSLAAYPMAIALCQLAGMFMGQGIHLIPELSIINLLIAFCLAMITGLISGAYPAAKASRLEPAECFRRK